MTANKVSMVLPQLEYALDKLHDTVLEAAVLNSNVDKPIHSQCVNIESILSQCGNDTGDTRLLGLISKYMNIFGTQNQNNKDITSMLQTFSNVLNNIDQPREGLQDEDSSEYSHTKKVRFSDDIDMVLPPRASQPEEGFTPYHDNINEDFNATASSEASIQPLDFNQQGTALQKQDIQLDSLSRSVEWTHSLSRQMNDEISSQNETVLTDLEANIDHNQKNLNRIMNHRILKNSDLDNRTKDQLCMLILVLILILFFLLIVF